MKPHRPRLLVTRPERQAEVLVAASESLGFDVTHVPCLEIHASDAVIQQADIEKQNAILFVSTNAVVYANDKLPMPWHGATVYAIGDATARLLKNFGHSIALDPIAPFNSESFVQLLKQQATLPDHLLIIKGIGGRDYIEQALESEKTTVKTLDVYERRIPVPASSLKTAFVEPFDIISAMSNETLENLITLALPHYPALFNADLIVSSERMRIRAKELGFDGEILVPSTAGEHGQLKALTDWVNKKEFS